MRQSLAMALVFGCGVGCSLIYNPNDLGQPTDAKVFHDALPPDVEVIADADPASLAIAEIYPTSIDEGRGSNGSTPGLFVIRGSNFEDGSAGGLVVSLTPVGSASPLSFTPTVSSDHNFIALQVIAPVDRACGEGSKNQYTVGVVQNGAPMRTLSTMFTEVCHDELGSGAGSATLVTTTPMPMFSQVDVGGSLIISGAGSAIIQSASTIEVDGAITANASGATAGPGGGAGGGGGNAGGGPGGGAGGGLTAAGAGFVIAGSSASGSGTGGSIAGDLAITTYVTNMASGGGGCSACQLLGGSHAGGGGGGTVELTAHGDITVNSIAARGGDATAAAAGNGAGGVIVLRAIGGTIHGAVMFDVSPGSAGYASSSGRTRVDGRTDDALAAAYFGPGIDNSPLVSVVQQVQISFTGEPTMPYDGYVENRAGEFQTFTFVGGADGSGHGYGPATTTVTLTAGYNQICAFTGSVMLMPTNTDISRNCVEMAFLP